MAFGQRDYEIRPAYLERISSPPLDLHSGSWTTWPTRTGAREAINGWVARQTIGRIPKLLTPVDVTQARPA